MMKSTTRIHDKFGSNGQLKTVTMNIIFFLNRLEHQRLHEKHKGHDAMHAEMVIILLVTLIVAQVALVEWKKRHYRSYSVRFYRLRISIT